VLCTPEARPDVADQFSAHLISVHTDTLLPARRYEMRIGTHSVAASVIHLKHRLNIDNHNKLAASILRANEIGYADMSTAIPVAFDRYTDNRSTGAFVLVDPATDTIIALGLVEHPLRRATNVYREAALIDKTARAEMKSQSPKCIWLTGLSGSGKSTLAKALEQRLHQFGRHTMVLDGDNLRHGLNKDLGFTEADRVENIRRAGEVARLMVESGIIVICSFISPFHADRAMVRELFPPGEFVEVFVDTPLEECIRRDRKGLYAKAIRGEIPNFTGIGSPYEPPTQAELVIRFTPKHGDAEVSLEDRIAADVYKIIELVDR
jgi:bifunctional enzyme CysN/CysC